VSEPTAPQFVEIFAANADQPDISRRLLAACDELGVAQESVATVFQGFRVPADVAEAAGFSASEDGAVDAMAVEGKALTNTAVAQRPAPAGGVAATDGAQTGGTLARSGNEPNGGATHAEATTGAPTEADVPEGDPNGGLTHGAPPPVEGARDETHTGLPAKSTENVADASDTGGDDEGGPAEGELRGEALDEALRAADLPTTGRVAEKQARLAAHRAGQ